MCKPKELRNKPEQPHNFVPPGPSSCAAYRIRVQDPSMSLQWSLQL